MHDKSRMIGDAMFLFQLTVVTICIQTLHIEINHHFLDSFLFFFFFFLGGGGEICIKNFLLVIILMASCIHQQAILS